MNGNEPRSRQRDDMCTARRDPSKGELRQGNLLLGSDRLDFLENCEIVLQVLWLTRAVRIREITGLWRERGNNLTSSWKRSNWRRMSFSGRSFVLVMVPVNNPLPNGLNERQRPVPAANEVLAASRICDHRDAEFLSGCDDCRNVSK